MQKTISSTSAVLPLNVNTVRVSEIEGYRQLHHGPFGWFDALHRARLERTGD